MKMLVYCGCCIYSNRVLFTLEVNTFNHDQADVKGAVCCEYLLFA